MNGKPSYYGPGLFDRLRQMEDEMQDAFGRGPWSAGIRSVARGSYPPINVGATADRVDVYLFAAGLDPEKLDITIQQNLLAVGGERKAPEAAGADYYRRERFDGTFRRVITLPDDVDPEHVEASYRDGVLQIRVQRRESSRPRQIKIK